MKQEAGVFLLALRTEKPNRSNLDYIRELHRRNGTLVTSSFVTRWFKKRFNYPGSFRKPNIVPLDRFNTGNLLRYIDFCNVIDKFPDKTVLNFLDEKNIVNKDALPSKIRADPLTGFMHFIPISGDLHDAFNLLQSFQRTKTRAIRLNGLLGAKMAIHISLLLSSST